MDIKSYVVMLRESLDKKLQILDEIVRENEKQTDVIRDVNALPEDMDIIIDRKSELIDEMNSLDEGFNEVFKRVEDALKTQKDAYADDIAKMKLAIRMIADRSAEIEAQEAKNSELAKEKFSYIKTQIQKISKSQQAVNKYYRNMMKASYQDPQFLDNKK